MLDLKKRYVTNEKHQPIAVQVDLETFNKMEELLEDFALGKIMEEENKTPVALQEAKTYYNKLKKG